MSSLIGPLIQLMKTGFTKAAQRLDGVYALLSVAKIAAFDIKAGANLISIKNTKLFLVLVADILWGCQ